MDTTNFPERTKEERQSPKHLEFERKRSYHMAFDKAQSRYMLEHLLLNVDMPPALTRTTLCIIIIVGAVGITILRMGFGLV
jgi:hypothetical protein